SVSRSGVMVRKVCCSFWTLPSSWVSISVATTVFWWTSSPAQRRWITCIFSRSLVFGQRKVRKTYNVPMRAHPLWDGDIHLFWRTSISFWDGLFRFKDGNDLCSLTPPILSHFHLHLCPQRHGAFGTNSGSELSPQLWV